MVPVMTSPGVAEERSRFPPDPFEKAFGSDIRFCDRPIFCPHWGLPTLSPRALLYPLNQLRTKAQKPDFNLPEKLKAELPGILNWAIEGCINWQDQGLNPPQVVQKATQTYRQEMDTLADFLAECCIAAPGTSVLASDLYKAYTRWAEENGEKKPFHQRDFGLILTERGFEGKRSTGGKAVRQGIGLRVK